MVDGAWLNLNSTDNAIASQQLSELTLNGLENLTILNVLLLAEGFKLAWGKAKHSTYSTL